MGGAGRAPAAETLVWHVTTAAGITAIERDGHIRPAIGPRSRQLGETTAQVYCFPGRAAMVDGVVNWLAELYADDESLWALQIRWPGPIIASTVDWEVLIREPIPSSCVCLREPLG